MNGEKEELPFPLPDGTERADELCPAIEGFVCYKILMPYKPTLDWFYETAKSEQWNLGWTSDAKPFSAVLSKNDKLLRVHFYDFDQFSSVLIGEIEQE